MEPGRPPRKIIHVDMDAFYTSVEQRDRPELRGKPVIVGGTPDGRGVVASASYEARRFGIRSAMSSRQASRLCPRAIFVSPNFSKYKEVSRQIRAIFLDATELVEPLSLDEAYLDVTVNKLGEPSATRVATGIRERIRAELGLTASAGVGPNKFIAKVASDLKKPDGLVVISPDKVKDFVATLPVEKLWGVGPATTKKLHANKLRTAADLRACQPQLLVGLLGKFGMFLYALAHGEDDRKVSADREPKSRGAETTFESDIRDRDTLKTTLDSLAQDVAGSLQRLGRPGRTIVLKVRYDDFSTVTRSRTLAGGTDSAAAILQTAVDLLVSATEAGHRPVRLLGISVNNLAFPESEDGEQLRLDF